MATTPARSGSAPDRYLELLRGYAPRPIRGDDDHRRAIAVIDGLLDRAARTPEEEDYLEVLSLVVGAYEDSIYDHPDFSGPERLRYLLAEHGLSAVDLARETGLPARDVSAILAGRRRIGPEARAALGARFGVPAALFA